MLILLSRRQEKTKSNYIAAGAATRDSQQLMSASNRFARSHYFHRGYLTVHLEESAKRARLELTQSGRLETGILSRVHAASNARFHERLSSR